MTRMSALRGRWLLRDLAVTALVVVLGCNHALDTAHIAYPPPPLLACSPVTAEQDSAGECPSATNSEKTQPPAALPEPQSIDLPAALRLANVQNPEIAVARERILEALAQLERAEALWLPDLNAGPEWRRHDGQIQRSTGEVPTVSRSSLWVGGGPALYLDLSEAILAPLAARQITAAREAGAAGVTNDRLLDVAIAYINLLEVFAETRINEETYHNARHLLDITASHERSGTGSAADTARSRTELNMRERERLELQGRTGTASARLARLLQLPPDLALKPIEPAIVPVALIPEEAPLAALLSQALGNHPELAESRALVLAALERWRAARVAPLVPNLNLAYAAGGFGGGRNGFFGDFDGRSDFVAGALWQLRNFGLGDLARARERRSQYAQAAFRQNAVAARLAEDVVEAFSLAFARRRELASAQQAVAAARESYRLNEERIRRAPEQGRPIELLQAIQALSRARLDYLQVVAGYNRAQFRLYTTLGNPPLCALDRMTTIPTAEPTVPPPSTVDELPQPRRPS